MPATLSSCQAVLSSLGCDLPLDDAALRPGHERHSIMAFLAERLIRPAVLSQLFSRLDELHPQPKLAEEERHAQRYVTLLKQVGVSTTLDTIRGCVPAQESLELLHKLAALVQLKEGPAVASTTGSQDFTTANQQQEHLGMYAPLLDFTCSNFAQLTAESSQLFPTDIAKATARHSALADKILSSSSDWSSRLSDRIQVLTTDVQAASDQVTSTDYASWQQQLRDLEAHLHELLTAMDTFSAVYTKELAVWCESLPPTRLYGLGQQASTMLETYHRARSVLESVTTIHAMHDAIACSAPPLVAYQPKVVMRIAEGARREAALLTKQVAILRQAIDLQQAAIQQQHSAVCLHQASGSTMEVD